MPSFIAVDVETANADQASICSIGLVSFREGRLAKSVSYLIDPEDHFDAINVSIHGITPEQVRGAAKLRDVYPILAQVLSGCVVAHHSPFDRIAFQRAGLKLDMPMIGGEWIDTCSVARRAWLDLKSRGGYDLRSLADHFHIDFNHHRACEDARTAGQIFLMAIAHSGLTVNEWLARVKQPINLASRARACTPGEPTGPLYGETIVFTGALSISREAASAMATRLGCNVSGNVTKKTTILVVGDQDARLLAAHGKSAKHRKAEQSIQAGQQLRIISETDFNTMMVAH